MKDFLGEYQHSLDAKGRLIMPSDFRGPLADGAVIGIGTHNCLVVYTPEEWVSAAEGIRELSRQGGDQLDAARAFFAGARVGAAAPGWASRARATVRSVGLSSGT